MIDLPKIAKEVYNTEAFTETEIKFKKIILDLIIELKSCKFKCNKLQHEYNNLHTLTMDKLMENYNQEFDLY